MIPSLRQYSVQPLGARLVYVPRRRGAYQRCVVTFVKVIGSPLILGDSGVGRASVDFEF